MTTQQKNNTKTASFIYEEELDQTLRDSARDRTDRTGNKSKIESKLIILNNIAPNEQKQKDIILRVEGEDFRVEKEKIASILPYLKDYLTQYEKVCSLLINIYKL